jgi:putative membrane protein (TIGR04086 family)
LGIRFVEGFALYITSSLAFDKPAHMLYCLCDVEAMCEHLSDAAVRGSWGEDTMNIRWMAVMTGFIVDIVATSLLLLLAFPQSLFSADFTQSSNLISISLGILATCIGGYVAGRMAPVQRWLHGLLVGVVGVLLVQLQLTLGSAQLLTHTDVIALALGCLAGALGGLLSRFPPQRQARS